MDTWNITLSNTIQSFTLDTWNITLSNETISAYTLDTWNITLSSTTEGEILDTWNLTLSNTIQPYVLDTWNLTLGNTTISHGILEPSFETVTHWTYYENDTNCDGEHSSSGVTDGSKSYGLTINAHVDTGYCKVYQTNINLTDIEHFYVDFYLNSDEIIDVPAYFSVRINDNIVYERKIGPQETILLRDNLINVSAYNDYSTIEFRLNQTDIGGYDEGIYAYIDNIRLKIWHSLDTWNLTLGNMSISPYTLDMWNLTLSNTVQPYILDTWNITLSNTPESIILDTWNITLSNTIETNILDTWNLTMSNTPSPDILDTWNITLSNTIESIILDTWNITLGNLTILPYILDTWNITLSNTAEPIILDTWNITLSNTPSPYILDTWNLTIGNLTISPYILDTWNLTIGNLTISSFIIDTWNLTLSNTVQPYILDTWNITLSNTVQSYTLDTWNLTLSNTTIRPDPPSGFTATAYNSTQINLIWSKGADANYTYIERNTSGVTSWARGTGTEIYNDTGTNYEDTNRTVGVTYYYQGWSWNTTNARWSATNSSDNAVTIGLTCSFIYDVTGSTVAVTPTITASTHYKWIVENGGETEWIPIGDIHDQQFVFPSGGKYKITLTAKDITSSINYSRTVTVKISPELIPSEPLETVPEVKKPVVKNVFTDTGISDWLEDRNIGEFSLIGIMAILVLFILFKKRKKKLVIYPIKKEKKEK